MGTDIHGIVQTRNGDGNWQDAEVPFYRGRSYVLFSVLANVRNGVGFAGIYTYEPIAPISVPRGRPGGISDDHDLGDHSFSHVTLEELLAYNWDASISRGGYVSAGEFASYEKNGQPDSWCGDVWGHGIEKISSDEMRSRLDTGVSCKNCYAFIQWNTPIRRDVPDGWFDFIEKLKELGEPAKVRLVFGFDS